MLDRVRERTLRRPRELAVGNLGTLAEDLEPDLALALEVGGTGSRGSLGHVELEGARVGDVGVDGEAQVVAGLDGQSLGRRVGGVDVAADVVRRDVGHGAVGVVVGSHANILPVLSDLALVDQGREGICAMLDLLGFQA